MGGVSKKRESSGGFNKVSPNLYDSFVGDKLIERSHTLSTLDFTSLSFLFGLSTKIFSLVQKPRGEEIFPRLSWPVENDDFY